MASRARPRTRRARSKVVDGLDGAERVFLDMIAELAIDHLRRRAGGAASPSEAT